MAPRSPTAVRGYSRDLALIHDAGYAGFSRDAAPAILRMLREAKVGGGLVVDVGCGSGLLASSLVGAGFDVLGLDVSPSMIRLAKAREPRARFRIASWTRADLPSCRAIVSIGECLSYRFDRTAGQAALKSFLRRARTALDPDGILIFDLLVRLPSGVPRSWVAGRTGNGWAVISASEVERSGRILRRRIASFRRAGRRYRRTNELHELVLLDRRAVIASLKTAGFAVRTIRSYGSARFAPHQMGFVARAR